MLLSERLQDFASEVSGAATYAPDLYPDWSYVNYEENISELKKLWAEIRPILRVELDKAEFIENKLQEAFRAFDVGENELGRDAMWEIYNLGVKTLR